MNPGGAHKGGEGEVSVTVQIEPTVVVTIPDPGVGSVVMTVVGPVGPPGPVHDTLNVYVPAISGVPVVLRILNCTPFTISASCLVPVWMG